MNIEESAKEATSYLPTKSAKAALIGVAILSGLICWVLQYLQADTLIQRA